MATTPLRPGTERPGLPSRQARAPAFKLLVLLLAASAGGDYRSEKLRQLGPVLDDWPARNNIHYAYELRYPADRLPDYQLKIARYAGRDDLTVRQRQELDQAEAKAGVDYDGDL